MLEGLAADPAKLKALCALWQSTEHEAWLTLRGMSMAPTFTDGTRLKVRFSTGLPNVGAVTAYRRQGMLVVHRLTSTTTEPGSGEPLLIFRGDGNAVEDPPVRVDAVVGVVVKACPPKLPYWLRRAFRNRFFALKQVIGKLRVRIGRS